MKKWQAQILALAQRTIFRHPGAAWATVAVAFVGLRLLWIHAQRPAHLEENAATYGSIRQFYGPAQFNHDGSKFTFAATADDRGRAIFLGDSATGQKKQIIEDKHGVGIWNDDFDIQAGPWSPDDSAFVIKIDNQLFVSGPETNQILAHFDIGTNVVGSDVVWLNSTQFAWHESGALCYAEKGSDGDWKEYRFPYQGQITSLTAIDSHRIAWLQDSLLCRLDLSQDLTGPNSPLARVNVEDDKSPLTNGLVLWLDASTLQLADQAPVTALEDLSPRRNKAVSNQRPPKFNAPGNGSALNGHGTISFSSSTNATDSAGLVTTASSHITGNKPRTVFAVMRREVGRAMSLGCGNAAVGGAYFGLADQFDGFHLPSTMATDGRVPVTPRNWNILSVVHDGNSQLGYLNGDLKCTTPAQLATADAPIEIGARTTQNGGGTAGADGGFAELLVYDRALSQAERHRVESYLAVKYFNKKMLSPQSPLIWANTGLHGLTGIAGSRETGEVLISRTEAGRDYILRLSSSASPGTVPMEVMQGQSLRGVQWAGPNAFVYTSHLDTRDALLVRDLATGGQRQLLQLWGNGSFDWFQATSKQLFIFGNISNAPAGGIWRCDLDSSTWHPVLSSSDYPSTPPVTVQRQSIAIAGASVNVTTYRPANFNKKKKYPLVIGDTMITDPIYGEPFMTGMAACGATVAVVERPWWTVGIEQWAQNVQGLYDQLKHDPTVDTKRVYLFAASAETQYLSRLVETNAAPWRGLILLNPGVLPDYSKTPWFQSRPKMLLDAGGEEHREDRFKRYQQDALNFGVVLEFYTHPGETHRMVGTAAKLERSRELKHFIFEE